MSTQVDRLVVTPYSQKVVPISNGVGAKPPTGRGGNKSTVNKTPTTLEATKPHQGGTISVRKINTGKDMKPVLVAGKTETGVPPRLDEINRKVKEEVTKNFSEVKRLFQVYDRVESFHVTKGDFKRVLTEGMGIRMTDSEFDQLFEKGGVKDMRNKSGCVNYVMFMQNNFDNNSMQDSANWLKLMSKRMRTQSPQPDVNMERMERSLREKINLNLHNIIRALHLFDYNRDEHVQKHEMRKILENFCFRMTDNQFDR
ncbi:EF-hand calcium-binding domain-containing protein 6-like isoform X2 [Convolutriloba macropyga]|uniref:EF-hand calcium-binding domain-containing protein 6-like isoform X2 n=1 Tax=Convolutriloba macropyga TaxID=536237 RepID=UPI003F51BB85